jgi:single-strand DNA-binding protein
LGCVSHITTTTSKEVFQMNSVNITGRLTADPELRALPSGENVCKLRLAVAGLAPARETGYVNVSCFGKPGEAAARVLSRGWLVAVSGRLAYHAWEADDGSKRHDYELVGNIEFLSAPRGNGPRPAPEHEEAVAS